MYVITDVENSIERMWVDNKRKEAKVTSYEAIHGIVAQV